MMWCVISDYEDQISGFIFVWMHLGSTCTCEFVYSIFNTVINSTFYITLKHCQEFRLNFEPENTQISHAPVWIF